MTLNLSDYPMSFQEVKSLLKTQIFEKDDDGQEIHNHKQLLFKNCLILYEYIFDEEFKKTKNTKLSSHLITSIWVFFNIGTQTRNLYDMLKYKNITKIIESKSILSDLEVFKDIEKTKPVLLCEISSILHCSYLQDLELKANLTNLLHFRQTIFNSEYCLDWYKNNNHSVIIKPITKAEDENIINIKKMHKLLNMFDDSKYDPIFNK